MGHSIGAIPPRLARERRTLEAMIGLYCRGLHHANGALCGGCTALLDYALCRLDHCPFGIEKTTCARCQVHCYKLAMRARIKEVMRYAGPRMLYRHPILALWHQWDEFRKPKGDE